VLHSKRVTQIARTWVGRTSSAASGAASRSERMKRDMIPPQLNDRTLNRMP
jgi:hypothetical protein